MARIVITMVTADVVGPRSGTIFQIESKLVDFVHDTFSTRPWYLLLDTGAHGSAQSHLECHFLARLAMFPSVRHESSLGGDIIEGSES